MKSSQGSKIRFALVPICMGMANICLQKVDVLEPFYAQYRWAHAILLSMVGSIVSVILGWNHIKTPIMFMYSCFLKPLGHHGDQQSRLESFYQGQAHSKLYLFSIKLNDKRRTKCHDDCYSTV